MKLSELMSTTPESLAKVQYDALKQHVLNILKQAYDNVKEDKGAGKTPTFYSPAGDGYGLDNSCIDFDYEGKGDPLDFVEVCDRLMVLKTLSEKEDK